MFQYTSNKESKTGNSQLKTYYHTSQPNITGFRHTGFNIQNYIDYNMKAITLKINVQVKVEKSHDHINICRNKSLGKIQHPYMIF